MASAGLETANRTVWEAVYDMTMTLGIDGGSSDESDCDPNSKRIIVRERNWRSPRIKDIMKRLDDIKPKRTGLGRFIPGNPGRPRERRENGLHVSQDTELRGLPENFYDPIWLNSLSPIQRKGLDIKPPKQLPVPTSSPYN